jgi:SAM-dependent methyltransferase
MIFDSTMKWYRKLFASKYDTFMSGVEEEFYPVRARLLSDLKGTILDVGSGTGANFEHFNSDAKVIAIEPSEFMLEKSLDETAYERHYHDVQSRCK